MSNFPLVCIVNCQWSYGKVYSSLNISHLLRSCRNSLNNCHREWWRTRQKGTHELPHGERNGDGDTWQFTIFFIWKTLATHSDSRGRTQSRRVRWRQVFMSTERVRKEWIDRKQCLEWGPIRPEVWGTCGLDNLYWSVSVPYFPFPTQILSWQIARNFFSLISWGEQESIATLTDLRANLSDPQRESLIGLRQNSICIIPFICPL